MSVLWKDMYIETDIVFADMTTKALNVKQRSDKNLLRVKGLNEIDSLEPVSLAPKLWKRNSAEELQYIRNNTSGGSSTPTKELPSCPSPLRNFQSIETEEINSLLFNEFKCDSQSMDDCEETSSTLTFSNPTIPPAFIFCTTNDSISSVSMSKQTTPPRDIINKHASTETFYTTPPNSLKA